MKKYITSLATLSGTCGIAYEVLYSRMISTYLGDMFYVAAATLTVFLLSLGVGSLIAQKWPKSLGWIEIAIGIYALILSYLFKYYGESFVSTLVGLPASTPVLLTLSVLIVLALPAVMIGFSVPLFTLYRNSFNSIEAYGKDLGWVYCGYNFGAAICVLAIEYILLRTLGISSAIQFIAVINVVIGIAVIRIPVKEISIQKGFFQLDHRELSLFLASFSSGVLQLFVLKIVGRIFGPYNENFSIVLFLALSGIALGSAFVTYTKIRFHQLLFLAGISCTISFSTLGAIIYLWAELNLAYFSALSLSWVLKIGIISVIALIPFTLIGGAIPALLKESTTTVSAGQALALSSFGNCAGYLAILFVFHQSFADENIAILIISGLMISAALFIFTRLSGVILLTALIGIISLPMLWPTELLQIDSRNLAHPSNIVRALEHKESAETYRGVNSTIDLISTKNNELLYIINGYQSLAIGGEKKANLRELIFGMSPALFSKNHSSALVLGLGTGITSAGAASIYKQVDVVEISPLVIEMIEVFEKQNLSLSSKSHVKIKLQDGLIALMQTDRKYDAIINTVTSPAYFSSAKLYTVDFFKLAAEKLNQNGVYSIWFDGWLTDKGVGIILNSLKHVFSDCRPLHLSTGYHQIICSNMPLQLNRNLDWNPEMVNYFSDELFITMPPEKFIANLIVSNHPRFPNKSITDSEWSEPLNTFDRPSLEFDISMNLFDLYNRKEKSINYPTLHLSPYNDSQLTPFQLAERCAAFTIVADFVDTECLTNALEGLGNIDISHYLKLVFPHYLKLEKPTRALEVINTIKEKFISPDSDAYIISQIIPLMCRSGLSYRQGTFYQYLFVNSMVDAGERIPEKVLISMRSPQAIPEARLLAKKLIAVFSLPKNKKFIERNVNPCDVNSHFRFGKL